MRYKTKTKQSLAALTALVMFTSVLAMGFAGTAAANAQDIENFDAEDVVAGTSSVNQTVTVAGLENDNSSETITITPNADLTGVLTDARLVDDGGHNVSDVSTATNGNGETTNGNGEIVIALDGNSGATDDIVIEVEHDLDDTALVGTVEYNASFGGTLGSQTTTFDVSPEQPTFTDGNSTIQNVGGETGSQINVTFDQPIQVAEGASTNDIAGAFSVDNVSKADGTSLSVDSGSISDDTVTLELNGYIASDTAASDLNVSYDGAADNGGERTSSDDVIAHGNDDTVPALSSSEDTAPTGNTLPQVVSASVSDETPSNLSVTFSEDIDAADDDLNADGVFSFDTNNFQTDTNVVENGSEGDQNGVVLGLDTEVPPADNYDDLSYDSASGTIVSTASSNETAATGKTVDNNVVPTIEDATIYNSNPSQIEISLSDSSNASLITQGESLSSGFELTGTDSSGAAISDTLVNTTDGNVTIELTSAVESADGSISVSTSGTDAVQSAAGVDTENSSTDVNNNFVPTFDSAIVTDENPDQLTVTFTEDVVTNVSNGNINSAVTDAFTLAGTENTYRIRNLSSHSGDTIVLNLGSESGTPDPVSSTDDLSSALNYTPTAPDSGEDYPFIAESGTNESVEAFTNQSVTNDVGIDAQLTVRGQYLEVTFNEDISRAGTASEVVNEFTINGTDAANFTLDEDSFAGIENGDTVVFDNGADHTNAGSVVSNQTDVNSSSDITLDYSPSGALVNSNDNNPDSFTGEAVTNNIQPFITDANVYQGSPGSLNLSYSEDVTESGSAKSEFSLTGPDAVGIDSVNSTLGANDEVKLTLAEDVPNDADPGNIEYAGTDSDNIQSSVSDAVAIQDDSSGVSVDVAPTPTLDSATVDDAAINNNYTNDGEMLLTFDEDVNTTGENATGLAFDAGTNDISVSLNDINQNATALASDDVVVVGYTSDSNSEGSNIQEGDDLSSATLTVDDPSIVDIESDTGSNAIEENQISDVSNEIATDLATVDSTEINVSLIGTNYSETGDFQVTVTGFEDDDGDKVIDQQVTLDMGGADTAAVENVNLPRFGDTVTITETPTDLETANTDTGETVDVGVEGANVTNADTVGYAHDVFTKNSGWDLTSQPMPGEALTGENITDVTQYDPDASNESNEFVSYDEASVVSNVHRAHFIHADEDGAEYGFAYDEDRSGQQTNVGSIALSEGWHIVGSNYDISDTNSIEVGDDLSIEQDINGSSVSVQPKSLPGTQLDSDYAVDKNEAYYVYLHNEDSRPIVLPEYTQDS